MENQDNQIIEPTFNALFHAISNPLGTMYIYKLAPVNVMVTDVNTKVTWVGKNNLTKKDGKIRSKNFTYTASALKFARKIGLSMLRDEMNEL